MLDRCRLLPFQVLDLEFIKHLTNQLETLRVILPEGFYSDKFTIPHSVFAWILKMCKNSTPKCIELGDNEDADTFSLVFALGK